jgi:hypothetical protein
MNNLPYNNPANPSRLGDEDSNGLMVKFKTKYYKFWKFMRAIKEKIASGHTVNTAWFTSAIQNKVYAFLNEKGREYCDSNSIIQLRNEFENKK